jgi:hypothetical protein
MALFINASTPNSIVPAVNLGEPKTNASGGKNIAVFDKNARTILCFSSPDGITTYGVNTNAFDASKPPTYDMTLQLNKTEQSLAFIQNMLDLETHIKEEAFKNSKKWFGKQVSKEVINEFWTPFLRYPKNKDTGDVDYTKSPTLRLKLPFFDNTFKYLEVYNTSNQLVFPKEGAVLGDLIPKGSEVKCLIRLNGVWLAAGKFGLTAKPIQIITRPKTRLMPGVCQLSMSMTSSCDDDDMQETMPEEIEQKRSESAELKVAVEDSDEDPDPDKEYAADAADVTESSGSAEAPVKRRLRVKKGN